MTLIVIPMPTLPNYFNATKEQLKNGQREQHNLKSILEQLDFEMVGRHRTRTLWQNLPTRSLPEFGYTWPSHER
jgi:hypothetical protein